MNLIRRILGTSALLGATAASGFGLAELSASVVKHAANKVLGTAADAVQPLIVEAYGRVTAGIAQKQIEEKIENIFIPPEIREGLENIEQAVQKIEKERERLRDPNNVEFEKLQKIFSERETKQEKDPLKLEWHDFGRGRKVRK